jgi:parallel beta-helix repeat protein
MKKLIIVILTLVCSQTFATNYYFSDVSGNDGRTSVQAQSSATPWKSISKLNSIFSTLVDGDSILFKRGETFYGSIVIGHAHIKFGAYGTGNKPNVSGFTTVSAWTNLGGNIWESTSAVSTLSTCNIASIGGANYSQGRTPNTGYWTIVSTNGNSITDGTNLNAVTRNWTGAQVVLRKYRWITDKYTISSASGSTINFTSSGDAIQTGWGYFIMNDQRCLDIANEWSYNSTTKKISIYSVGSPAVTVKVPSLANAVDLNGYSNCSFSNIIFTGFNNYGITGPGVDYPTISNCDFSFIGNIAIHQYLQGGDASYSTISGNTFTDIGNMGVYAGSSSNSLITNNTLSHIGRYPGMGGNGDVSYCGIVNVGSNQTVSYNTIRAVGYCGIRFDGDAALIQGNFVDSTNFVKDDGGGIYCYPNQTGPNATVTYTQRTVRDNIVINSIGALAGGEPSSNYGEAMAFYNDGTSPNINYINNTAANSYYGFFSNSGRNMLFDSNTVYNCTRGIHIVKYSGFPIDNWTITNNTSVSKETNQYPVYYEPGGATLPASWTLDNNIYARPVSDNQTVWIDFNGTNYYYTLAQWKTVSGKDLNSTKSPVGIVSSSLIKFDYNNENTVKNEPLVGTYVTMKNATVQTFIAIQPYRSSILLKTNGGNVNPTANAGVDKTIKLPVNSTTLSGSGSDPDGSVSAYTWTKISGPGTPVIVSPNTASTVINNLVQGTYQFQLRVTDNSGAFGYDIAIVTVNPANVLPTVSAGADRSITLPTNSLTITGTATDSDGTITTLWTKLSGPAAGVISNASILAPTITALTAGTYTYELKATDNDAGVKRDTMQLIVWNIPNQAPVANAGTDKSITLPINSISIVGSATDANNNISSYLWSKVSGPGGAISGNAATLNLTGLVAGTYVLQLQVTDDSSATGTDNMTLTVNEAPVSNIAPVVVVGMDQIVTWKKSLTQVSTTLTGSATDADGTISSYLWEKIGGPNAYTFGTANQPSTTVVFTRTGTYDFRLTATDNLGATATGVIRVIVRSRTWIIRGEDVLIIQ